MGQCYPTNEKDGQRYPANHSPEGARPSITPNTEWHGGNGTAGESLNQRVLAFLVG